MLPPVSGVRSTFAVTPASPLQWTSGSAFQPASINVSFKTTPVVGDTLIVVFWNNGQSSGAANTYTPPAGWSLIDQNVSGWYTGYQAFTHVVASGETGAYAFAPAAAQRTTAWIGTDVGATGGIDTAKNLYISSNTSWTTPVLTPAQANDLALVFQLPFYAYTWTNPADWTLGTGPTSQWHGESLYQQLSSTSAVSETSTYSSAANGFSAILLIAPSSSQPTPTPTPSPTPIPTATPTPGPSGPAPVPVQWISGNAFQPASITISFKTAPAVGDTLLVAFWNNGQSSGAANTYTPPAGWNLVDQNVSGWYTGYQSFTHLVASGETNSYAFTPAAAQRTTTWIASEVSGAGGIDAAKNVYVNNSATWTTPTVTPAQPNDLAVAFQLPFSANTWTNPSGWTLGTGPTSQWHGESLYEQPGSTSAVSQTSTYSAATYGYSAIVLMSASGTQSTPTPAPVDWGTFGYDLGRTGYNPDEKTIGTGSFGTMHALWSSVPNVGGTVQGEPVVAMNVNVGGTSHNLMYAGGASGVLDALDADSGVTVWSKSLGNSTYLCSGTPSTWGIEGTGALDRARNRIYVPDGQNRVHALDLATGAEASGWPVAIAAVTGDDFIHVAMTYNAANGYLYAETSSTCDISPWYGRIAAINTSTAAIVKTFYPEQGTSGGGIWGVGGASIDPATNNVFIAVGNADSTPENAYYGEQIVELSADLSTVIDHNYPPNMPVMTDSDFGATPLLFQPVGCPALLAAINKSGAFVLYNRTNLAAGPTQQITMSGTGDRFRGVPSYDPATNYVYVGLPTTYGIYSPGVAAFSVNASCTLNTTPVWNALFGTSGDLRSPITIANGVVYVGGYNENAVYAFDAAGGTKLWTGSLGGPAQIGPVVVNGRLYVVDKAGYVHAWTP